MAPPIIGNNTKVPLRTRNLFYQDPYFADCWSAIEKQKKEFEQDSNIVYGKVFGNSYLRSISLLAPTTLADYVKPSSSNNTNEIQFQAKNGFDANCYKVILDVRHFNPEELSVSPSKTEKNVVIIDGKHREKKEDSAGVLVSREFTRKCKFPFNVETNAIQCNLSSDGVLQLIVPKAGLRNGFKPKQRELMTVDGRKLSESDIDLRKLDTKFVRGGPVLNGVNNDSYNGMYWNSVVQTLPNFDAVPFWKRTTENSGFTELQSDANNFNVWVDLKHFSPDELNVKSTDSFLLVEAKHGEKEDPFGSISRQFTKRIYLPKGVNTQTIQSCLNSNGILQITIPKLKPKPANEQQQLRNIPITMSNQAQAVPIRKEGPSQANNHKIIAGTAQKAQKLEQILNGHGYSTNEKIIPIRKSEAPAINANTVAVSNFNDERAIVPFGITAH